MTSIFKEPINHEQIMKIIKSSLNGESVKYIHGLEIVRTAIDDLAKDSNNISARNTLLKCLPHMYEMGTRMKQIPMEAMVLDYMLGENHPKLYRDIQKMYDSLKQI